MVNSTRHFRYRTRSKMEKKNHYKQLKYTFFVSYFHVPKLTFINFHRIRQTKLKIKAIYAKVWLFADWYGKRNDEWKSFWGSRRHDAAVRWTSGHWPTRLTYACVDISASMRCPRYSSEFRPSIFIFVSTYSHQTIRVERPKVAVVERHVEVRSIFTSLNHIRLRFRWIERRFVVRRLSITASLFIHSSLDSCLAAFNFHAVDIAH